MSKSSDRERLRPEEPEEPEELEELVRAAIRLGWTVAEVRGRNRPGGPADNAPAVPPRTDDPLPLRIQRSPDELRIESQVALSYLARQLGVHRYPAGNQLPWQIDQATADLAAARDTATRDPIPADPQRIDQAWQRLAHLLWQFDAHAQDRLAAESDSLASGYQLGRGLAETYWALDPDAAQGWSSWAFLFNSTRCDELSRLAGRLAGHMREFSAAAIAGSLQVWRAVAGDENWRRQPTARQDLRNQIRNWYELLVLDQDPTRMIKPYDLLRSWRVTLRAVRAYLLQLVLAGVALATVIALAFVLTQKHPAAPAEWILSAAGTAGVSAAGLSTKLKNETQTLSTRLRQDAYTDLIAVSITSVPPLPNGHPGKSRRAVAEATVTSRTITPSTPLAP